MAIVLVKGNNPTQTPNTIDQLKRDSLSLFASAKRPNMATAVAGPAKW